MFPSIPSIDNTNNATPEAIDVDDAINNNLITSPTPLIRRPGAKQVQKDHSPYDIIGNVHDLCYVSLFEPKNTDEKGHIMRKKLDFYTQIEGLDFDETFAPIARLLLSIVCHLMFKLHQMDVKSAFLNGVIQEELYVEQAAGFIDLINLDQVQQFNEWILISQTKCAKNLVSKFGMESSKATRNPMSTSDKLYKDSKGKSVDQKLYRSMIDPKESHLSVVKRILRYVSGSTNFGVYYSFNSNVELAGYSDADSARNIDDRKSTTGSCFYVGNNLVSWFSKKQCVSLSTAEAEYIIAGSGCTQLLWMKLKGILWEWCCKQMLTDYGLPQDKMTIFCDNLSAINISNNPVQHSRTKHIDIRHHFIRDLVEDNILSLEFITTDKQLANIFTKPLHNFRFETLRKSLGVCSLD
ncbi:unnamed protein product [Prunus brigantina]